MGRIWVLLFWVSLAAAQDVKDVFIVELANEPAIVRGRAGGNRLGMLERRARIRTEQEAVGTALERQAGAKVVGSIDTVANALILQAPGADAARLASYRGVKRVYPDREIKLRLDHAVPLQKVPEAWNRAGGLDRAGLGIKIGILDTGIDQTHPGFQDDSLPIPDGFPKASKDSDFAYSSHKIIVARTYEDLLGVEGGGTPEDQMGHGTAVAMIAAGVPNQSPNGMITGIAPKAYIGNYKVFTGTSGTSRASVILKAIDDAVKDGMDVINLSLGSALASRPADSIEAQAIESAAAAGVIVVAAAGNQGPDPNTIDDFGSALSAIAVGASWNDRTFGTAVMVEGLQPVLASPGTGSRSDEPVSGTLADVAQLDQTGLACTELPGGSLQGRIALILRGECDFEIKLNHAESAGAIGAIVYTDAARPNVDFTMATGTATLPSQLISYADGSAIKARIAASETPLNATLSFERGPLPADPNQLASFTSKGPNSDFGIKPDLVAVGLNVSTAAENSSSGGVAFDPSGYAVQSGTSFSAPMIAGAAAVLKAAWPGLAERQYRSLLINTASPLTIAEKPAAVQHAGTGVLNLDNAMQSTLAAYPTSLGFGIGGSTADVSREITVTNLGQVTDTFTLSAQPHGEAPAPELSSYFVQLDPGASQTISARFAASGLTAGEYQGFLQIHSTATPVSARLPYWYGVPSGVPAFLTVLESRESGTPGSLLRNAVYFRVTDAAGIPIPDITPSITVLAGDGEIEQIRSIDADVPGTYTLNFRLGPDAGANTLEINIEGLPAKQVTIQGRSGSDTIHP